MVSPIHQHPQVEKAINRLRAMGLKASIYQEDEKNAYIFIELNSILKLIDKQIKYPCHRTYLEDNYVVIKVWKD